MCKTKIILRRSMQESKIEKYTSTDVIDFLLQTLRFKYDANE